MKQTGHFIINTHGFMSDKVYQNLQSALEAASWISQINDCEILQAGLFTSNGGLVKAYGRVFNIAHFDKE